MIVCAGRSGCASYAASTPWPAAIRPLVSSITGGLHGPEALDARGDGLQVVAGVVLPSAGMEALQVLELDAVRGRSGFWHGTSGVT